MVTFGQAMLATMETACVLFCLNRIEAGRKAKHALQNDGSQQFGFHCWRKNSIVDGKEEAEAKAAGPSAKKSEAALIEAAAAAKDAETNFKADESQQQLKERGSKEILSKESFIFLDRCAFSFNVLVSVLCFLWLISIWVIGKSPPKHYS